ncbi:hypothetical protein IMZ48_43920 [Candidatus Bathyarchaeota archaeon]|nr:hypothetical protein [Candidatus Bathyarchaeota archaeon]
MASPDSIQQVFIAAKREFESKLPQNTPFGDAFDIATIKEVREAADKLQRNQSKKSGLLHLSRIDPFLKRLERYAEVIQVFVQAKPEILALIWGPIKLLLLWTSEWREGFDAIIRTIERIGEFFPQFDDLLPNFTDKKHIMDVLGLFYRDILDFYLELLKFFGQRSKFCWGLPLPTAS